MLQPPLPFAVPCINFANPLVDDRPRHSSAHSLNHPPNALMLDSPNLGGRRGKLLFYKQICAHSARNFLCNKKGVAVLHLLTFHMLSQKACGRLSKLVFNLAHGTVFVQ